MPSVCRASRTGQSRLVPAALLALSLEEHCSGQVLGQAMGRKALCLLWVNSPWQACCLKDYSWLNNTETLRPFCSQGKQKERLIISQIYQSKYIRLMSIPLANTLSEQVDTCIFPVIEKKSYSVGKSSTNPRNFLYAIKLLMKPLSPACFSFNIFLESHTHGPWVYKSGTGASFIFWGTSLGGSGLAGRGGGCWQGTFPPGTQGFSCRFLFFCSASCIYESSYKCLYVSSFSK